MKNTTRYDLSDRLFHFFRDVNISSGDAPSVPEHLGWGNVNEDVNWSALFMLRCAIRQCRLWATWSRRKGVRTIYGSAPAVCFTEMPLAALLEAGEARRSRGEAMSPFAIVLPKHKMFALGARPVIYGLDDQYVSIPNGKDGGPRLIPPERLPTQEQYRYVTFNPTGTYPVDWTHEREWRWPYRGDLTKTEAQLAEFGVIDEAEDMPGLDLSNPSLYGMGVLVETAIEANWIVHDLLSMIDRGVVSRSQFMFVLKGKELTDRESLRAPSEVEKAIASASVDLEPYFSLSASEDATFENNFKNAVTQVDSEHPYHESGEPGSVWLWLLDNTHTLTRALLKKGRVIVSRDRRYLAALPEFSATRSLRQREEMVRALADRITRQYGIECGYFSVLNSCDPDDLPFYGDAHLDNSMYFNVSWE